MKKNDFNGEGQANKTLLKEAIEILNPIFGNGEAMIEEENGHSGEQNNQEGSGDDGNGEESNHEASENEHEEAAKATSEDEVAAQPTQSTLPTKQPKRVKSRVSKQSKKRRCV